MTILQTTTNSEPEKIKRISRGQLAYVASRNQHNAHNVLLRAIKESGKSQKELSRLTGIDEATISRILRRPSNFQINTYSKLLYAACGALISILPSFPQFARHQVIQVLDFETSRVSAERRFVYGSGQVANLHSLDDTVGQIFLDTAGIRVVEMSYA